MKPQLSRPHLSEFSVNQTQEMTALLEYWLVLLGLIFSMLFQELFTQKYGVFRLKDSKRLIECSCDLCVKFSDLFTISTNATACTEWVSHRWCYVVWSMRQLGKWLYEIRKKISQLCVCTLHFLQGYSPNHTSSAFEWLYQLCTISERIKQHLLLICLHTG